MGRSLSKCIMGRSLSKCIMGRSLSNVYCCCLLLITVICVLYLDDIGTSVTIVHHDSEQPTVVNGYQEPGSYVRPIKYTATIREQFDELVARTTYCEQYIKYKCFNSRLLGDAGKCTWNSIILYC